MTNELEVTQKKLNMELSDSLDNAVEIITKNYLSRLENYEIVTPSAEDVDINIVECGKFYRLSKLVVSREENFLDKLTTVVNVASSIDCTLATIIKSDGLAVDYCFGIISKNSRGMKEAQRRRRQADADAFRGALEGNLTGSFLEEIPEDEMSRFRDEVLGREENCYSAVSGIVALRDEKDKKMDGYVQGIENLLDSLKGQKYTVVMLADPVDTDKLQVVRQGYELLHTQLSTFAHSTVTIDESDTQSLSRAQTKGISEGISKGIAMTQSVTQSAGKYFGGNANIGFSFGINAGVGINAGKNTSTANTSGRSTTTAQTRQHNTATTDTASDAKTTGRSLSLDYENRTVRSLLDKIDRYLERLNECESFGAFDCAAYVIAPSRETALTVASNYNALMRGRNSDIQASHINMWYKPEETRVLGRYLRSLVHPRFWQNKIAGIIVSPASMVSGNELTIQIGLPKKSVPGITVIPMASFGRNAEEANDHSIVFGNLHHMGKDEGKNDRAQKVAIDIESLAMHTFITGSTGVGKSSAIYSILEKLMERKIRFLVIEPAKGEYKNRFGGYENVSVYGTNYKKMPLLKINPFSFPQDIHVLEHIDRLIEIFNVCWPMYAAMPAVLKDAVERAYMVSGWDLDTSECRYRNGQDMPLFPTFADVLGQINNVMEESAYSADSKGDYKGALCTRLKSLTNGLYGQIFTGSEFTAEELFDSNVIVDLSRVGSGETKALLMGLLVMKLQEHRMANAAGGNEPLRHVTVLEEAHNILKRTPQQSGEEAGLAGKSVEMLANSIAEMRTYGEGFLIADQAPGMMDPAVIRNTNTKIILRLPDLSDRELVGRAASLNDDQILELSRLKTFVAAVYQNNWLEPVLCNIDVDLREQIPYSYRGKLSDNCDKKIEIIRFLLLPFEKRRELKTAYISALIDDIYTMPIPAEAKVSFIKYVRAEKKEEIQRFREQVVYNIFNSDTAFGLAKDRESQVGSWFDYIKEVLEPDITFLPEREQHTLVAILTKERARLDKRPESIDLFNKWVDHI